ncbi:hypothetical protein [Hymenobacter chitinivorans]|uniref:SMI1/KNR4 family protein SUKH-1 n=1 Tax=Hymenobacter chitinivorans DSM 11115 TaxID=1121954 RepID=A0A2M9B4Z6_9BACT|nr:hypothetical protein [Hymenobacter chitinivorans]PJJ53023.1 hypothetical protein CLV45_3681 [Hymenobacter chitinivorans DSM 11115]
MIPSNNSLAASIMELRQFWQRQAIACPPADLAYVRQVAATNSVVLPPDFELLYSTVSGPPQLYPNYMDENGFSLLPVEALRTENKAVLVRTSHSAIQGQAAITEFVDYLHRSWVYGFIADADGSGYRIGIMPTKQVFKVLTTSLAEFLAWYVADADVLYDYEEPV